MCQKNSIEDIKTYASQDKHSLIIEGPSGSGKTYIARQYAKILGVEDIQIIVPKVNDIRNILDECYYLETDILICIENLDQANPSCAAVLLKCMEEPRRNMYFVVTCTDMNRIPDTLVSRSMTTHVNPPTLNDITYYFSSKYSEKFDLVKRNTLVNCIKSFSDVDYVSNMSIEQINYFSNFNSAKCFNDTVANITWKLGHYDDRSEAPVDLILRYIINRNSTNKHVVSSCVNCMNELQKKRIAKHLVLSKLAFELKYCE